MENFRQTLSLLELKMTETRKRLARKGRIYLMRGSELLVKALLVARTAAIKTSGGGGVTRDPESLLLRWGKSGRASI